MRSDLHFEYGEAVMQLFYTKSGGGVASAAAVNLDSTFSLTDFIFLQKKLPSPEKTSEIHRFLIWSCVIDRREVFHLHDNHPFRSGHKDKGCGCLT